MKHWQTQMHTHYAMVAANSLTSKQSQSPYLLQNIFSQSKIVTSACASDSRNQQILKTLFPSDQVGTICGFTALL